jgi:transposase
LLFVPPPGPPSAAKGATNVSKKRRSEHQLPILQPHAAGVDIGADEIYVAVPADRDPQPVRRFGTFTPDLHELADWLTQCGIRSVAMESTAVYWIPLHQVLEERGFEIYLVNAHYLKNVPGRKSDASDCQWIQYLHSVGLLRASFRPPADICAVRSLWRHRETLLQSASQQTLLMQKALDQMNLQLHRVLSSITGLSGLTILDAILAGERDPLQLAALCHRQVKNSRERIAKALQGDYRREHLFALQQSLDAYRYFRRLIAQLDAELKSYLQELPTSTAAQSELPKGTKLRQKERNDPAFDLRSELYRVVGVDLTDVPGISVMTAQTIVSEIGAGVARFPNASAFASWLGLCPEKQVSGGRVLYTRTRKVKNRNCECIENGSNLPVSRQKLFGRLLPPNEA